MIKFLVDVFPGRQELLRCHLESMIEYRDHKQEDWDSPLSVLNHINLMVLLCSSLYDVFSYDSNVPSPDFMRMNKVTDDDGKKHILLIAKSSIGQGKFQVLMDDDAPIPSDATLEDLMEVLSDMVHKMEFIPNKGEE